MLTDGGYSTATGPLRRTRPGSTVPQTTPAYVSMTEEGMPVSQGLRTERNYDEFSEGLPALQSPARLVSESSSRDMAVHLGNSLVHGQGSRAFDESMDQSSLDAHSTRESVVAQPTSRRETPGSASIDPEMSKVPEDSSDGLVNSAKPAQTMLPGPSTRHGQAMLPQRPRSFQLSPERVDEGNEGMTAVTSNSAEAGESSLGEAAKEWKRRERRKSNHPKGEEEPGTPTFPGIRRS